MDDNRCCSTCYYESFDSRAYPCSRCTRNLPSRDMWQAKTVKDINVRNKEPYFVTSDGIEFYAKD